jgi:septal ring factor EnvC (AmiA/AmiB activator)
MKMLMKTAFITLLLFVLLLSACAPPPPPVSQDQLSVALRETTAEEQKANELAKEKAKLEKELASKQAELEKLEQYKRQLMAE